MKVAHFITDNKFLNGAIEVLNEIDWLDNHYFILTCNASFKYVRPDFVQIVNDSQVKMLIKDIYSWDVIVIHGLLSLPLNYIKDVHEHIKVVWLSWGYDVYSSHRYPYPSLIPLHNYIKPGTLDSFNKFLYYSKWIVKEYVLRILMIKEKDRKSFKPAINRIDFYSGVFPIEYKLIKLHNSFFVAKPILFHYFSTMTKTRYREEDIYKDILPKGNNIQVGHNAGIFGNHRNTFSYLKNMDLAGRKIIVPLSYRVDRFYVSSVCKAGTRLFGESFIPIVKFMPLDEYRNYMSSISVAIYNFERQAAAGNIIMNLWNGTMVFLPKNSICYIHFKQLGFHIFSIENDLNQFNIDHGLSEEEIIKNRTILSKINSYESLFKDINDGFLSIRESLKNA